MKTLLCMFALFLATTTGFAAEVIYKGAKPDVIIDVRTPEEYAGGHIDGAINLPVERIGKDFGSIKGLTPQSTILLYCRSGRRSAVAAEILGQKGYTRVLDGGGIDTLAGALKKCPGGVC